MQQDPKRLRTDAGLMSLGFAAASGQAILFREFALTFDGNEIVASALLASWLLLAGIGSLAGSFRRRKGSRRLATWGPCLLGPALFASLMLARVARPFLASIPGLSPAFPAMALASIVLLAPFCLLAGALFPLLLKEAGNGVRSASRGYAVESAGFLAGGIVSAFLIIPLLSNFHGTLVVIVLTVGTASAAGKGASVRIVSGIIAAVALILALLPWSAGIDQLTRGMRFPGERLEAARDTTFGTVTVTEKEGLFTFRELGVWSGDTGNGPAPEEFTHLILLAHPKPESVAMLGGGEGGELAEALKHAVRVDFVRLDRRALDLFSRYLPPEDRLALVDHRVRLHFEDGRAFLKRARAIGRLFDVVMVPMGDPLTGFVNRFYTAEFFREVAGVLRPGGLLGINLSATPGYRSAPRARLFASVHRSLGEAFSSVRVLETDHAGFVLLASKEEIRLSKDPLLWRMAERKISASHISPGWLPAVLQRTGFEPGGEGAETRETPANRDLKPASYLLAFALWRSRFGSTSVLELALVLLPPLVLLLASVLAAAKRGTRRAKGGALALSIASVGLAGMVFEVGLLLAFQASSGYVYTYLGALIAAFMAGAALGAWFGRGARRPARAAFLAGAAFGLFGFFGFLGLPLLASESHLFLSLPLYMGLQLLAGLLTGVFFPQVLAIHRGKDASEGAGILYGADLGGAALGALLAGAVAIPLLGIPLMLLVAGGIAFLGGIGMLWAGKGPNAA